MAKTIDLRRGGRIILRGGVTKTPGPKSPKKVGAGKRN